MSALPNPAPTPNLHLRLVRQAVPAAPRLTGKSVAKAALELALKLPMLDAVKQAIRQLAEPGMFTDEQVARISGLALKLITEGLRADDAISVALHEPAHLRPHTPLPEVLKSHFFPQRLNGENVLKLALEINHHGVKMDEAIVAAVRRAAAPAPITAGQASAVLDAAQALFKEGRQAAEAFDLALRRTLLKAG